MGGNKMKKITLLILVLSMVYTLVACGSNSTSNGSADTDETVAETKNEKTNDKDSFSGTVKVGHLAVMSGADDYLGVPTTKAMEDFIDEVNANGGWLGNKVELVTYDIARGVEEVAPACTKMIEEDNVIAILGPTYSAGATAAQPVCTEAGVPLIALSATNANVTVNEKTGEVYDWMYRVCFTDNYQAEGIANFLIDEGIFLFCRNG